MVVKMNELATMDATAQAELVRQGDVSALELVDAAIARIEQLNPKLNAVIHKHFERARAQAPVSYPKVRFAAFLFYSRT